jgi:imidazolonepropionase-like amidohydrolase
MAPITENMMSGFIPKTKIVALNLLTSKPNIMRKVQLLLLGLIIGLLVQAQETFPVNGVADPRTRFYAFVHATIVKDAQTTLPNATLLIKEGKIVAVGNAVTIPADAVVIDCKNKYLYPSFIDAYTDYGVTAPTRPAGGFNYMAPTQFTSNIKGAYGWNQAIKPQVNAIDQFNADDKKAEPYRMMGFGTVLTHVKDGIARGTGAVVTLASEADNFAVVKEKASAHYSFSKGSSTQSYPSSLMGSIALLRQTYLDAKWYKNKPVTEGTNLSLEAWNNLQSLPQIFEADDKWNDLRADRIGDEFGVQYIIKGGGNEYQRMPEMIASKATYILPLNFPQAMDVEDPNDARFVSLADMKNWELAPTNPAAFEKAKIPFCLTTSDLKDVKQFLPNLRKAIADGLSEKAALEALTKTPATILNVYDKVGSLDAGKYANFIITTGPVFDENTKLVENWIQGRNYAINPAEWNTVSGQYTLTIQSKKGTQQYPLIVKNSTTAQIQQADTVTVKLSYDGKAVKMQFALGNHKNAEGERPHRAGQYLLSGMALKENWTGTGRDDQGNAFTWTATYQQPLPAETANNRKRMASQPMAKVTYPFDGYGFEEMPKQQTLLIKNGTVWTNEKEGIVTNTDILIKNGKIAKVGKNLSDATATVIDATGMHVTPGIIDEHSHIAAASINEGGQSVTSEVRIGDNLNPDDINIYRQLSGGVTTSHILHGSANTIGGQTQLIKLRWGADDEQLKFAGADPFIKFALGENVKRTTSPANNRFPDTRMGVEQVMVDAFTRALDYEAAMKKDPINTRRDLELDALVEILNKKRFITCHSYVQSEITAAMRVAERFGFRFNTFTHILEGYKVADKMKAHGANTSTFSDWWAYKNEVKDAIAYNASIMHKVGLNVCINSDDAEMARRLNQEAAKSIKYGGMSEEDALKMVTINPAKALHVDNQVGSIKEGKDADIVIWSANPLSIYASAQKTIVDGIVYFDRESDAQMRKKIQEERNRLIQKMIGEKRSGAPVMRPQPSWQYVLSCGDHDHHDGMITIDISEEDGLSAETLQNLSTNN